MKTRSLSAFSAAFGGGVRVVENVSTGLLFAIKPLASKLSCRCYLNNFLSCYQAQS
jgi:hypothetical protein